MSSPETSDARREALVARSRPSLRLRGVLFDMDGTLVDSEKVWDVTLDALAAHLGGALSPATRLAMVGSDLSASIAMVHAALGVDDDPARSGRWLLDRTKEHFARGLPWRPGARELLAAVRDAGLATALVTSTNRELVDVALLSIGGGFDVIVCGDEVARPKPDPEPYVNAAHLLGVQPGACVAIEDSATGTASAEAAGCAVLVVPSEAPVPDGPGRTLRPSLEGVDVAFLAGLVGASARR